MTLTSLPIFLGETVKYTSVGPVLYQTVCFPYGLSFELKPTHVMLPYVVDPRKYGSLSNPEYNARMYLNTEAAAVKKSTAQRQQKPPFAQADDQRLQSSQKQPVQKAQVEHNGPWITESNLTLLGKRKTAPSEIDEASKTPEADGDPTEQNDIWSPHSDSRSDISETYKDSKRFHNSVRDLDSAPAKVDHCTPELVESSEQDSCATTLRQDDDLLLVGKEYFTTREHEVIEIDPSEEDETLFVDPDLGEVSSQSATRESQIQTIDLTDTQENLNEKEYDPGSPSDPPQAEPGSKPLPRTTLDQEQELVEWSGRLKLSKAARGVALKMYRVAKDARSLKFRSSRSILAAAIVAGSRHVGKPIQFRDVQLVAQVPYVEIGRTYKLLEPILRDDPSFMVGVTTLTTLVRRTCMQLGYREKVIKAADFIAHRIDDNNLLAGKTPNTIASCAIYFTCLLIDSTTDGAGIARYLNIKAAELRINYVALWGVRAQLVNPAWHMTEKDIERWEVSEAALK